MSQFQDEYSRMYDLLYRSKPYKDELEFVLSKVGLPIPLVSQNVLDIGCGSGRHLEFVATAGRVTGVDQSESMLAHAATRVPGAELVCCTADQFDGRSDYDLVYSIFHVVNYMVANVDLFSFFECMARSLNGRGRGFIDFWNRAAWIHSLPEVRSVHGSGDQIAFSRTSKPTTIDEQTGYVRIEIETFVSTDDQPYERFVEHHEMRAYTDFELELAAMQAGLKVEAKGGWNSDGALSSESWYGWMSFSKI